MELLTQAMAHQRDVDMLHDLGRILAGSSAAVRRRGGPGLERVPRAGNGQ